MVGIEAAAITVVRLIEVEMGMVRIDPAVVVVDAAAIRGGRIGEDVGIVEAERVPHLYEEAAAIE